jgi:hypothetical protein
MTAPASAIAPRVRRIHGIDFSADARSARRHLRITSGDIESGVLHLRGCFPAADLPGSSADLLSCLKALRDFVAAHHDSVIGMDFPFGLRRKLVGEASWPMVRVARA